LILGVDSLLAAQVDGEMRREDGFLCGFWLPAKFSHTHTHMSPWLQVVSSLLQHASIITDNLLCCLRCETPELNNRCLLLEALIHHRLGSTLVTRKGWV